MKHQMLHTKLWIGLGVLCLAASSVQSQASRTGQVEEVHRFYGPMPTGVTVSHEGRIFVNFPRWGDPVTHTVAELKDGKEVAFPPGIVNGQNQPEKLKALPQADRLVSVQSVVVDPKNRLWILDTGSVKFGPVSYGGPKLVGVDLKTNKIFKTILFPQDVALPSTYLNDVRFDLRRGKAGMAFITDSSSQGPNAIIVVDLESGHSFRRLNGHRTEQPEHKFLPIVEGQPMMNRPPGKFPSYLMIGADGIALNADGKRLFYCPLASRRLYSVSVDELVNQAIPDSQVPASVIDHGEKGASDGLEADDKGRIYLTNYEHSAILRRLPNGLHETVAHDPRMLWPDTLSVARNGYLYFTANQLHRQPGFHHGKDLRRKPYLLLRTKIDAGPVLLK